MFKGFFNSFLILRLIVAFVFITEGIQKFLYPHKLGVGRFLKIGIPFSEITAPFVGGVEIVLSLFVFFRFYLKLSLIPLIIVMLTAIISTKIPILIKQSFFAFSHEARTDLLLLSILLFLFSNTSKTKTKGKFYF